MFYRYLIAFFLLPLSLVWAHRPATGEIFWMKLAAKSAAERTALLAQGLAIDHGIHDDYAIAYGSAEDLAIAKASGKLLEHFAMGPELLDFPPKDANFHNYQEMLAEIEAIRQLQPEILQIESIGQSHEARELINIRISGQMAIADSLPGILFTGTHHAREHLSTEMPLKLARALVEAYVAGDPEIRRLVDSRDIHIVPMLNPDGVEWDIADGNYKMWRKNRRDNGDGSMGVDLNRNYGFGWGTGGSSQRTSSDVYMGPSPFSEPETQAIQNFIAQRQNISILLSFHSFSELILYPWGGRDEPIANERDRRVHEVMASEMARWNGYTPQKSSDLYIASGDTTDWAYGEHGIISFTFELDPRSMWSGGFYPGQAKIPVVFQKNYRPCLYLIDLADNPYRVLQSRGRALGFQTDWMR